MSTFHIVTTLVLLNCTLTLRAVFGESEEPFGVGSSTFVLRSPLFRCITTAGLVILEPTSEAVDITTLTVDCTSYYGFYFNTIFTAGSRTPSERFTAVRVGNGEFFVIFVHFFLGKVFQIHRLGDYDVAAGAWTFPKEEIFWSVDLEVDVVTQALFTEDVITLKELELTSRGFVEAHGASKSIARWKILNLSGV
jgi:hypothetical protein